MYEYEARVVAVGCASVIASDLRPCYSFGKLGAIYVLFLAASSHIYKGTRPSVCLSVGQLFLVTLSVGRAVCRLVSS